MPTSNTRKVATNFTRCQKIRPLIAVTGPATRFSWGWLGARLSIFLAGGRAVRLTAKNAAEQDKTRFHGVVIGGGDDIDPALYDNDSAALAKIDAERDAFEIEMIKHALAVNLPILGICRGAQLINVVKGGSLHRDIRPQRQRTSNRSTPLPRKTAVTVDQGFISQCMIADSFAINSLHKQAVDRLGDGLKITARDLDGFVQAIEADDHPFLVGTQWHPEYLPYLSKHRCLFKLLIQAAQHSRAASIVNDTQ